jgi:hypothetical protein
MPLSIAITITDWVALTTITGDWVANTTYTGTYRQVNDTMETQIAIELSGAPTATTLSIDIPNGEAVDESKLPSTIDLYQVGSFTIWDDNVSEVRGTGQVLYNRTTNDLDLYIVTTAAPSISTQVSSTSPITFANNDYITMQFSVPITGW